MTRRQALLIILVAGAAVVLVVGCDNGANGDAHHEDAAVEAASGDAASDPIDVADGTEESSDAAAEGATGDASCATACGSACCQSDETCCLDQHGHNPSCFVGTQCVPPLQPVDGG